MRIGSLFTGYGGLDIAVQKFFGGEVVWYSEIDKAACTVLEAHHPTIPNLGDITKIDWSTVEPVDILTGGYPCQPFSMAGKRKGKDDERHLWPYVRDAVGALRPRFVFLENVRGHLSLGLADVVGEFAGLGYDCRWGVVRASDAGAPHGRARVFIVAYPTGAEWGGEKSEYLGASCGSAAELGECVSAATNADGSGSEARVDAGHDSQWVRVESMGLAATAADADGEGSQRHSSGGGEASTEGRGHVESGTAFLADSGGQRHGSGQGSAGMGRVDRAHEGSARERQRPRQEPGAGGAADAAKTFDWGQYESAIRRWERLTRPAPTPTIAGANGRQRLSPYFVEWMMGLPEGWVTGHGLTVANELKMLGNGVVWQQALTALGLLCPAGIPARLPYVATPAGRADDIE